MDIDMGVCPPPYLYGSEHCVGLLYSFLSTSQSLKFFSQQSQFHWLPYRDSDFRFRSGTNTSSRSDVNLGKKLRIF